MFLKSGSYISCLYINVICCDFPIDFPFYWPTDAGSSDTLRPSIKNSLFAVADPVFHVEWVVR